MYRIQIFLTSCKIFVFISFASSISFLSSMNDSLNSVCFFLIGDFIFISLSYSFFCGDIFNDVSISFLLISLCIFVKFFVCSFAITFIFFDGDSSSNSSDFCFNLSFNFVRDWCTSLMQPIGRVRIRSNKSSSDIFFIFKLSA